MSYARFAALLFAVLMTACLMGCQGSTEEAGAAAEDLADTAAEAVEEAGQDLAETASDLAEEAAKMTPEELQAKLDELTRQIEEKEGKLKELADQLKGLSPADLAGEAGQKLQAENVALTEEINALKEKVQAWTEAQVD
jgi:polyhydroxyalkanoate synthesis regulator phasin